MNGRIPIRCSALRIGVFQPPWTDGDFTPYPIAHCPRGRRRFDSEPVSGGDGGYAKDKLGCVLSLYRELFVVTQEMTRPINSESELNFGIPLKIGQIVKADMCSNLIPFGDNRGGSDIEEEILPGHRLHTDLPYERIDGSAASCQSPPRGLLRHRDGHGCHTRIVRDDRANPVSSGCKFFAHKRLTD